MNWFKKKFPSLFPSHPDLQVTWEPWAFIIALPVFLFGIFFPIVVSPFDEVKEEIKIQWSPFNFCIPLKVEEKLESPFQKEGVDDSDHIVFTTGAVSIGWDIESECPKPNFYVQVGVREDGTVVWRTVE